MRCSVFRCSGQPPLGFLPLPNRKVCAIQLTDHVVTTRCRHPSSLTSGPSRQEGWLFWVCISAARSSPSLLTRAQVASCSGLFS